MRFIRRRVYALLRILGISYILSRLGKEYLYEILEYIAATI